MKRKSWKLTFLIDKDMAIENLIEVNNILHFLKVDISPRIHLTLMTVETCTNTNMQKQH
jgi:hypothetical protein